MSERKNCFLEFTNLYEISKTLRFELRDTDATKSLIRENGFLERDELKDKDYDIIKPLFDQLHDEFIKESLSYVNIDWLQVYNIYKTYKRSLSLLNKDDIEEKQNLEDGYKQKLLEVRENIGKSYSKTAINWEKKWKDENGKFLLKIDEKEKKKNEEYKFLLKSGILKVLKLNFNNNEEIKNLLKNNKKAIEMLKRKFDFYLKKIENDFYWWKELYKNTELENFTIEEAKKYMNEIILKLEDKDEIEIKKQILKVIDNFDKFFTYLSGFSLNRENYYSIEDKSTAVAYRVVNQNFQFFIQNAVLWENIDENGEIKDGRLKEIAKDISLSKEEIEIFQFSNYNNYLSQGGIDKYNEIIGGKKDENGVRVSNGINQRLSEYFSKNGNKKIKLIQLYKQIGSIKAKSIPFQFIETNEDFGVVLTKMVKSSKDYIPKIKDKLLSVFEVESDLEKIWISKNKLNFISNRYFTDWDTIIKKGIELKIFQKKKKKTEDGEDFNIPKYISLLDLMNILEKTEYINNIDLEEDKKTYFFRKHFEVDKDGNSRRNGIINNWKFFKEIFKQDVLKLYNGEDEEVKIEIEDEKGNGKTEKIIIKSYENSLKELEKIKDNFNKKDNEQRKILKSFADIEVFIFNLLKLFNVEREKLEGELGNFYDEIYDEIIEKFLISKDYDSIRNYLTKKDFSEDKIKLNFNGGGWDSDFSTYGSLIFKKDSKFYIGIINGTGLTREEVEALKNGINENNISERMIYLSQKIDNKNPPRRFIRSKGSSFSPMVRDGLLNPNEIFNIDNQKLSILDIYDKGLFKKDTFKKSDDKKAYKKYLPILIKYFQEGFRKHEDFKVFKDNFTNWSDNYDTVADFYNETADLCYILKWEDMNFDKILELNKKKKLFLYQIYSKDFSEKSIGKNNIQTELFLELMKQENNKYLKLLGGGEIFFRQQSKKCINKNDLKDETKHLKTRNENAIDNKRYTEDKTILHFPILIKGRNLKEKFNLFTNENLLKINLEDLHIIGIDRGEKHLGFYSVINAKTGKIVEQGTLNIIEQIQANGSKRYTNYEKLLSQKAGNRLKARQEWETIGNIKNLKEGYISHVVKKIADLVLKYNGIIVMEKLNKGFKNSRIKIEQSVYQTLETKLASKLSYLVLKDVEKGKPGSMSHAYQLCPFAKNYSDIEKANQWGMIFFTNPKYTSVTDPITGWRKNIYLKKGTLDEMRKQILNFSEIGFDNKNNAYYFKYNPKNFGENGRGIDKDWIIWSGGDRFRRKQNKAGIWEIKEINNTTNELDGLFEKFDKNRYLLSQIEENNNLEAKFYESLIWIIEVILQIRNTSDKKEDFILSPIKCGDGKFFDSREHYNKLPEIEGVREELANHISVPTSGDANGAYNIARKGLIMFERIKNNPKEYKLFVSDDDWDKFLQNN